jgi:hypothetical protein
MKSRTTVQFRSMLAGLPKPVQSQTRKAYRLFQSNPGHTSLRFKKVHPKLPIYSARIGINYRAVGQLSDSSILWFWVGPHAEYDVLLRHL